MAIYEHITEFAGKEVVDWEPGTPLDDAEGRAYRIAISWDESEAGTRWAGKFAQFLEDPDSADVTGIVVGPWEQDFDTKAEIAVEIVQALAGARDRLPRLDAIFLGEITSEENEISWIEQSDVTPLLDAYPQLKHFAVRGGNGLRLANLRHEELETLIIESGGLPKVVVQDVLAADLPKLEYLELWLGIDQYGGDTTVDDLAPLLSGDLFPALTYLGLCDSEIADEIATAVATAPILERLDTLDLSMGNLTDAGAEALLASPALAGLQKLDISHHFCSEEMVARLEALPIEVEASEPQEPDTYDGETYRYVAVSE